MSGRDRRLDDKKFLMCAWCCQVNFLGDMYANGRWVESGRVGPSFEYRVALAKLQVTCQSLSCVAPLSDSSAALLALTRL